MKDEIVAARQTMVDTQLRQLSELQSLTKETRELKQTLTELHRQQQQSAADKHHQGNSTYSISLCRWLVLRVVIRQKYNTIWTGFKTIQHSVEPMYLRNWSLIGLPILAADAL